MKHQKKNLGGEKDETFVRLLAIERRKSKIYKQCHLLLTIDINILT